jgi:hypothetical protein
MFKLWINALANINVERAMWSPIYRRFWWRAALLRNSLLLGSIGVEPFQKA